MKYSNLNESLFLLRIYVKTRHDYLNQYQNKSFYFQHEHIYFQVFQRVLKINNIQKDILADEFFSIGDKEKINSN